MLLYTVENLQDADIEAIAQTEPTLLRLVYAGDVEAAHVAARKALAKLDPVAHDVPSLLQIINHVDVEVRRIVKELCLLKLHPTHFAQHVGSLLDMLIVHTTSEWEFTSGTGEMPIYEFAQKMLSRQSPEALGKHSERLLKMFTDPKGNAALHRMAR